MVNERTPVEQAPRERGVNRRWLTVALFASVIVNVFFGGLVAGRLLHREHWGGQSEYVERMGPMAGRVLQHLLAPLGSADRQIVLDTVGARSGDLLQLTHAVREQRDEIVRLFRADNFDRKAVDDAFVELRRRTDALQTAIASAISDAVEKLSPAARKQLQD